MQEREREIQTLDCRLVVTFACWAATFGPVLLCMCHAVRFACIDVKLLPVDHFCCAQGRAVLPPAYTGTLPDEAPAKLFQVMVDSERVAEWPLVVCP